MSEFGRPYKTSEELLEEVNDNLYYMIEQLQDGFGDMFDAINENLGSITESFSNSNTTKSMSSLEKFGKSLKNTPQVFALEQLTKLLEPFIQLLEPFAVIFDIISGLFQVMGSEILKSLFAALQPVYDILLMLMPVFKIIGQIVGEVIKVALIPLQVIFEVIGAVLKPFLPLLESLSPVIELVSSGISFLIRVAMVPLVSAIYAIGLGIAALINLFTFGTVDAIGNWNSLMLPILGSLVGLQEGGFVKGPTAAILGEGSEPEVVAPLSEAKKMMGGDNELHLIDIKEALQEQLVLQKKQAHMMNKRRFG